MQRFITALLTGLLACVLGGMALASPTIERRVDWYAPLADDEYILDDGFEVAIVTAQQLQRRSLTIDWFRSANMELNTTDDSDVALVDTAGLRLRNMTTAQRDAITCSGTTEGQLIYNSSDDQVNVCTSGAWAAFASGGGGEGLNATYVIGQNIGVTNALGTVDIDDDQTGAGTAVRIDGDGVVAAAASHTYFVIDSNATHTSTGTVRGADVDLSGMAIAGGTAEGLRLVMAANTDVALRVTTGDVVVTDGDLTLTNGAVTHTLGDMSLADGSISITDADNAASFSVTNDTATTIGAAAATGVVDFSSTTLTTGALLNLELTEGTLTTGWYVRGWDVTAGAAVFSFAENGALTIAGAAAGTDAVTLTAGDLTLTAGHVIQTLGNNTLTDGNLTLSEGTLAITNTTVGEAALTVTANGNRTVNAVDFTSNSAGNTEPFVDVNLSGAFGANSPFMDVDLSGAAAGNVFDVAVGAVLYTGDLVSLDTGATSTGGQALVVTGGAAARTTNLVAVTDSGTGAGGSSFFVSGNAAGANATHHVASFESTGTGAANTVQIQAGGAFTGNAVNVDMVNADVAAGALVITDAGARAWSDELVEITTSTGTGTADVAAIVYAGDGATDVLRLESNADAAHTGSLLELDGQDAQFEGDAVNINLTSAAAAAQGIVITEGGRATSGDVVSITDAGTSTADALAIAKTGAGSTGSAVELTGTVVAADAGDGKLLQVSYNGALVSQGGAGARASGTAVVNLEAVTTGWADDADNTPSYVLNVVGAAAGAATDGDFAVRIAATGANIEGLLVDDGTSQFDEAITVGDGTTGANVSTFNFDATGRLVLDGETAAVSTSTVGLLDINQDTATNNGRAMTSRVTPTAAGITGAAAGQFIVTGNATAITGNVRAADCQLVGNNDVGETGTFTCYDSFAAPANFNAATNLRFMHGETGFDIAAEFESGTVRFTDYAATIEASNTAGAGESITIAGAAGFAASAAAGSDIAITAGDGDGVGNGGDITITAGVTTTGIAGDVTVVLGVDNAGTSGRLVVQGSDDLGAAENWLVLSDATTPPLQVATSARPTKSSSIPGCAFAPNGTGTPACGTVNTLGGMLFDGAAAEQACALWPVPYDIDTSANIDVDFAWNGAAGNGVFRILTACGAGGTAINAPVELAAAAAFASDGVTDFTVDDAGSDIAAGPSYGQYCWICFERDGAAAGDTINAVDVALMQVVMNYTAITP